MLSWRGSQSQKKRWNSCGSWVTVATRPLYYGRRGAATSPLEPRERSLQDIHCSWLAPTSARPTFPFSSA
jgi:hypothetical protein